MSEKSKAAEIGQIADEIEALENDLRVVQGTAELSSLVFHSGSTQLYVTVKTEATANAMRGLLQVEISERMDRLWHDLKAAAAAT